MAESERRCILRGESCSPEQLIRLAIGPEGQVAPDVRAKAPGRGAWIGVTASELRDAIGNGRLRGGLARAFKGERVDISSDLPDRVEAALRAAFLDRLGLEARASNILIGSEKIDVAARRGQVRLLLHAADAATDGRRKLDQAWRVGMEEEGGDLTGLVLPVDRQALSVAMGRENVVHLAVTDKGASLRLRGALDRWQRYSGCANGAEPHDVPGASTDSVSSGQ